MKEINWTKYKTPRIRHHSNRAFYFGANEHTKNINFYPSVPERLNWCEIFSNGLPADCLDIGCGLGRFLIRYALNNPHENILGVEVRNLAVEWINEIIKGEDLGNAHALWYSAVNKLPFLDDNSISKIFYFFPDPWVKRRHNKRRVINVEFLNELHRILKDDGKLYLATDVDELTDYHIEQLVEFGKFEYRFTDEDEWDIMQRTNQEEFCLSKGIPYKRLICNKLK